MATAELDQVWRPSLGTRVGAGLLSAVGVVLAVGGLVTAVGGDWTGGLAVAAVFGLFPVFGWRWGTHPLLATSEDGWDHLYQDPDDGRLWSSRVRRANNTAAARRCLR